MRSTTPDQRAFVRRATVSGRFSHEDEAVQEALALWEERERSRLEILSALDEAEASLGRGEGRRRILPRLAPQAESDLR